MPSAWQQFKDAFIQSAVHSPLGGGGIARAYYKYKGYSDNQINQAIQRLDDQYAKKYAVPTGHEGDWKELNAEGAAARRQAAASLLGHVLGGVDPTYALAPGKGLVQRAIGQGVVQAPASVVRQGINVKTGMQDHIDPKQVAEEAASAMAFQGLAEGAVPAARAVGKFAKDALAGKPKPFHVDDVTPVAPTAGVPPIDPQMIGRVMNDARAVAPSDITVSGPKDTVVPTGPEPLRINNVRLVQDEQPPVSVQADTNEALAPKEPTPPEVAPEGSSIPEQSQLGRQHKGFTEVSSDDTGTKFLDYQASNGETIPIKMGIEPDGTAEIAIDQFSTKANRLGPREIRSAMSDLQEMYPEIKKFGGYRRSGAGKGRVQEITPKAPNDNVVSFETARQKNITKKLYTYLTDQEPPENLSMEDMVGAARNKFSEGGQNLTPAEMQEMDASVAPDQVPHSPDYRMTNDYDKHVPYVDTETLPAQAANDPTLGAAVKNGFKNIINDERGSLGYRDKNVEPEPEYPESIQRLAEALRKAKPARTKQNELFAEERSRRNAELTKTRQYTSGLQGFYAEGKTLQGEMPKVDFEPLSKHLSNDDVNALMDHVKNHPNLGFLQSWKARKGLAKMLQGELPEQGEVALLARTMPPELIRSLLENRSWLAKSADAVGNVLNISKALMASIDTSAPLRQGVLMIGRKDFYKALGPMVKALVSPKYEKAVRDAIYRDPLFPAMQDAGLAVPVYEGHNGGPALAEHEEAYMTNLAQKIPVVGIGVRASERAYNTFVYKLRADSFRSIYHAARADGKTWDAKSLHDLAKFINSFTGRGDLGKLNNVAPILNAGMFSPRLLKSRLDSLGVTDLVGGKFYSDMDPTVRKEALKSILSFATIAATVMGLAHLAGAEVNPDPRKADGWKIKVGNTRYDILGGEQQLVRLFSNIADYTYHKGKEVIQTGKIKPSYRERSAVDNVGQFLRNKESPVTSFVHDFYTGNDAVGRDFDLKRAVASRITPMSPSDVYDAADDLRKQGVPVDESVVYGFVKALPAFGGVGVMTYQPRPGKISQSSNEDPFKTDSNSDPFKENGNSDPFGGG